MELFTMSYYTTTDYKNPTLQEHLDVLPTSNQIKKIGEGRYITNCVASGHDDNDPSMVISQGNKTVVFKCFAGCSQQQLLDFFRTALGGR